MSQKYRIWQSTGEAITVEGEDYTIKKTGDGLKVSVRNVGKKTAVFEGAVGFTIVMEEKIKQ